MHSPKSSRASKPSLASESNLASTFLHNSSAWEAPLAVLLLMNLRPLSACCALDFVRWSPALILRASRADIVLRSSVSDIDVRELDCDFSHGNFRRILDVTERLLARNPSGSTSPFAAVVVGVTLQTTMESSSSSSVTSTVSWSSFRLRSLRNIGSIAPPIPCSPESSSLSSNCSNARLQLDRLELHLPKDDDDNLMIVR